jgi:hypothetical protein
MTDNGKPQDGGGWFRVPNVDVDLIPIIGVTAWAVLCVLRRRADAEGRSHPSVAGIARDIGKSVRTVQVNLTALVEAGKVAVESQPDGQFSPNCYRVTVPGLGMKPTTPQEALGCSPLHPGGAAHCAAGVQPTAPKQDPVVIRPIEGKKARAQYADEFEEWYGIYPRKAAKGQAAKAYRTARGKIDAETLLTATGLFAASPAGMAGKYTPYPATWLNAERWADDPATWQRNGNGRAADHEEPGRTLAEALAETRED